VTDVITKDFEFVDEDAVTYNGDGTGVEFEQIESTGNGHDESITEPFDPTLIRVETRPMTIDLLLTRIREEEIDLMPSFQRKPGIWTDAAQSRLIESILIRIPLPAFYMDATDDEKWLVVDGLQRLTTLKRFAIDKELRLTGLEFLTHLDGKRYDDLPRSFQRRIVETQVTLYLIEKGTPPKVKFNIFKRINTGGLPLSAQEIRHALNQGKATIFLERLANSNEFKKATSYSIRDERMTDRECVLRFLAFTITPFTEYRIQDFDGFLNEAMSAMNKMSDQEFKELERQFLRAMVAAFDLFGDRAFRKLYYKGARRSPINKALFEAWSVNLNKLNDEELQKLKERKDELNTTFIELMNDREFDSAISQGTGDVKKVKHRFGKIEGIIRKVLS
jgi:hypothetical protein